MTTHQPVAEKKPTIKGIFVLSHIAALRRVKGQAAITELERRYGHSLDIKNTDNIPVREEVKIIEHVLDLIGEHPARPYERTFAAGRLHFKNFSTTPLAKIIFSVYRHELKQVLMSAQNIAGHVFQGVRFQSTELGPSSVQITMENNDYPIDHFRGLFDEWVRFAGFTGSVVATEPSPGTYVYTIRWDDPKPTTL